MDTVFIKFNSQRRNNWSPYNMGPNSAVHLYSRLFFLLALGHAGLLKLEGLPQENIAVSPDELCPCIVRAECPRVFGTKPEDKLLGHFPPCEDPNSVRCCGVSVERTVSTNVRQTPDVTKNRFEEAEDPALRPGIIIPVPSVFPEYLDTRSSTASPKYEEEGDSYYDYYESESDEAITDVEKDAEDQRHSGEAPTSEIYVVKSSQRELNSSKSVKGENIDESISQTNAFVSSDYLDYRGVNKYGIKGGVQTITGSEQRGEISSSKRVESDKKTESIVNDGYSSDGRAPETMPELGQEEEEKLSTQSEFEKHKSASAESTDSRTATKGVEAGQDSDSQNSMVAAEDVNLVGVDYSLEKMDPVSRPALRLDNDRLNDSSPGSRRKTVVKSHQEGSGQQENETVATRSSNFEESTSSSLAVENGARKEVETNGQVAVRKRIPTITSRELESAINPRGKPDYRTRGLVSNQQRFQSVTKESRIVEEENSSSNDENVAMTDEKQAKVVTVGNIYGKRRRPTITVPRVASNSVMENALRTRGLRRPSSKFEEDSSSNVQSSTTNTGNLDHASEIIVTTARPAPELRRPPSIRSRMLSGQRKRVSYHQQNESGKEDSYLEKTTASSVQTVTSNTEELSHGEASLEKVGTTSIDESNHGQHEETNSTQEISETVPKGSSILEERNSPNTRDEATIAHETTSNVQSDATVTINEENQNQSLDVIQETVHSLMDSTVNVQQQTETSGEQKNETVPIASSISKEENIAPTSNLWNLVTGKQSLEEEAISSSTETEKISHSAMDMNREENTRSVLVGSRTYIPVLINTEFLRDPAIAALTLGQDPVSGVTQTDMLNPKRVPAMLPLSCGSVVFGEHFKDGRTLVCDILKDVASPIGPRELNDPIFPHAIMTGGAEASLEADDAMRSESESIAVNRNVEDSMTRDSRMSDPHSEESSKTITVETAKNDRPASLVRRTRVRRPIQVPVAEEHRERDAVEIMKPPRRVHRGRIRHGTNGRQSMPVVERTNTVEEDQPAVELRRLSASVQESESSQNSKRGAMAGPDFDLSSADEYEAAKGTAVRNSRSYTPPSLAPILPRPQEAKISKKKSRNSSSRKKLSSKDLDVAKMKTEFVDTANDSATPTFVSNRNSRQAIEFSPERKGVTISPDDLSMTGRISIVGLLPAGFKDPALETRVDELGIDLPRDSFRPSPIDPINWS